MYTVLNTDSAQPLCAHFHDSSLGYAGCPANFPKNRPIRPFSSLCYLLPLLFPFRTLCGITIAFLLVSSVCHPHQSNLHPLSPPNQVMQATSATTALRKLSARIFSLNVFIRPVLVGVNDYKDQRLTQLLQVLQSYDIVCLQELFSASGPRKKKFLERLLSKHGFHQYVSSPAPGFLSFFQFPPKLVDAGLAIVSKYPIVRTDYHTFSKAVSRSIDFLVAKGVLYARLSIFPDKPERFVHLFTTHLQASNGLEDASFERVRRTQLTEIVEFMQRMTADDANGVVIITGDFNVNARAGFDNSSSSEEYVAAMQILQSFRPHTTMKDLVYIANNLSHPVTTAGGLKGKTQKNERIDYILLSSDIPGKAGLVAEATAGSVHVNELRVDNTTANSPYDTLSDHYALQAEVQFLEPEA